MGVDHGDVEIRVSHEFLNRADVFAPFSGYIADE
jgi:hypothetical protein